jgi:hypothetical protein
MSNPAIAPAHAGWRRVSPNRTTARAFKRESVEAGGGGRECQISRGRSRPLHVSTEATQTQRDLSMEQIERRLIIVGVITALFMVAVMLIAYN